MFAGTTRTCVSTYARGAGTHGDVLDGHTTPYTTTQHRNERLQFMSRRDGLLLDESLGLDDVSMAWTVWSRAAETALADAYQFSGGPLPSKGLVLGRSSALFRWVQLGGPWVRRARANMLLMQLMFSCIVISRLLLCLT